MSSSAPRTVTRLEHLLQGVAVPDLAPEARALIHGRRVLITGAGGSIGSELSRQVLGLAPHSVTLLDRDDSLLHAVSMKLFGSGLFDSQAVALCDIRESEAVRRVFAKHRPEVVLHAAALKHLSLLETHPCEAVRTNVLGTHNLLQAAQEYGVGHFVLVSTDKAAEPTSVLGASKRAAEMLLPLFAGGSMRLASVRFGNVLGSRGSVLTSAWEQASQGEPVTVTDPAATRFLMSIPEACGLVLDAASMGREGETFVLDMGEPVRVVDLIAGYLRSRGIEEFDVRVTGLRPGEKLHEVVRAGTESASPTRNRRITIAKAIDRWDEAAPVLLRLYTAAEKFDEQATIEVLAELVPEYVPALAAGVAARKE